MTTRNQSDLEIPGLDQRARGEKEPRPPVPWGKLALLAFLLLLLGLLAYSAYYYSVNRRLPLPGIAVDQMVTPPEYLYSISGPRDGEALAYPIGVAVSPDNRVFVVDAQANVVRVYTTAGDHLYDFGEIDDGEFTEMPNPIYAKISPDGQLYVSDRLAKKVYVFELDGEYVRSITLASEEESGLWTPLALAFDEDGNLYVSDTGRSDLHQIVVFNPQGTEIRRFGTFGEVDTVGERPGVFNFPNGIAIDEDGRIFVADSNNRRVQVFSSDGRFERIIRTSGLPRGIVIDSERRLVVVDALAHRVDLYTLDGESVVSFGGTGIGPGQFRYPNDISLDSGGRMYISDRVNHQVQVWGWPPVVIIPPEVAESPWIWALCIPPLLLPLLLLALRRRRQVVTEDFVEAAIVAELIGEMDRRRWRWVTTPERHALFAGRTAEGRALDELIRAEEYSDSDVRALMNRLDAEYDEAAVLVMAQRRGRLFTQDARIASYARSLGVDVFDLARFRDRFVRGGE